MIILWIFGCLSLGSRKATTVCTWMLLDIAALVCVLSKATWMGFGYLLGWIRAHVGDGWSVRSLPHPRSLGLSPVQLLHTHLGTAVQLWCMWLA